MEYKILERNGDENENVDGAAFNNFCADGRNLIFKGVLNECNFVKNETNAIKIDTGELIIQGFRIKIVKPYIYSFSSFPAIDVKYEIIAKITLKKDRTVTFDFIVRTPQNLTQNNLYVNEEGVYEVVFGTFEHSPILGVTGLVRKANVEKHDDAITVDTELSTESENPVQNKVIAEALVTKLNFPKDGADEYGGSTRLLGISTNGKTQLFPRCNPTYIYNAKEYSLLVPAYRVAGRAISNISEFESGRLQNTIAVAEPILPYETANKKYVDDELAKIKGGTQLYYHEIEFGGYSTQYDKNFTVTVWCYTAKESEVFLVQELSSNRFRVVVTKTEDIIGKICSRKEYTALEDLMDSSYRTPENVVYREYELEIDAGSAFIEEEIIIAV